MEKIRMNDQNLQFIIPRKKQTHKGDYGRVLIFAGSTSFAGAAIFATSAAVNSGAGLTTLATDPTIFSSINNKIPEAMTLDYQDKVSVTNNFKQANVILFGPGFDVPENLEILEYIIEEISENQSLIIDAEGLNLLAKHPDLLQKLPENTILTPHQMEWQRISNINIADQSDQANIKFINTLPNKIILVLKSSGTKIYFEDHVFLNTAGNPGMAIGGSGDTLAGIIAGMIGQFSNAVEVVAGSVYFHSVLADEIFKHNYVVLPETLITYIPNFMNEISNTNYL